MASSFLYTESRDADALAVCASASLYNVNLEVKTVAGVQDLPKTAVLPLPAAGLPVLVLPSGVIVQGAAAACASFSGVYATALQFSAHGRCMYEVRRGAQLHFRSDGSSAATAAFDS